MFSFSTAVFDQFAKYSAFFHNRVPLRVKAICIVLILLLFSFFMGWVAFISHHKYLPMAVLGIFYGVVLSYPATMLLGPKLQSALGGALGGFSVGNISHLINHTTSSLGFLAQLIASAVQQILAAFQINPESKPLADGILLCLCLAIVTMILILVTSVYLTNDSNQKPDGPRFSPIDQAPHLAQVAGGNL
jgi:hypothetical protein